MPRERAHRRSRKAMLIPLAAAGLTGAAVRARRRAERAHIHDGATDVGYMRAMHDALRRDIARLESAVPAVAGAVDAAQELDQEWRELRARLERHHIAEDDDLWPMLRRHLTAPEDLAEIDLMIEEHRSLSAAITHVDRAIATGIGTMAAVVVFGGELHSHLDHEERSVLPLLERHLSRAEWRGFLITERRRTPLRDRPEFLGWVLDDANDADAEAVLSELPPPGRLVYRYVLGPRYAARHRRHRDRRAAR
jgi:hemerythrin-like domain-containing protein